MQFQIDCCFHSSPCSGKTPSPAPTRLQLLMGSLASAWPMPALSPTALDASSALTCVPQASGLIPTPRAQRGLEPSAHRMCANTRACNTQTSCTNTNMCTDTHTQHTHADMHMHVNTCTQTHITHMHTTVHVCTFTHADTVHTWEHMCRHADMFLHTHTCPGTSWLLPRVLTAPPLLQEPEAGGWQVTKQPEEGPGLFLRL